MVREKEGKGVCGVEWIAGTGGQWLDLFYLNLQ
jgi:hypothetical protein